MEQQDVFYDGAEYIETVSVGINSATFNLGSLSQPKSWKVKQKLHVHDVQT